MSESKIIVTKASGQQAPFSPEKLINSLARAGATEAAIAHVLQQMENELYEGISTRKIYQKAFAMLKKLPGSVAAKYKLKKALMELGPSGYPFERYIAHIFQVQGYETSVGVFTAGHCVTHEVDVIAEKSQELMMIECKYHGRTGLKCDVKIPLYIYARFKDIEKAWLKQAEKKDKKHLGWVVTNTRFTSEAIQYGNCAGLKLLGWDYPNSGSLRERIDLSGLHPITCLTKLKNAEKRWLLDQKVVLCRELLEKKDLLPSAGISPNRINAVIKEAENLCEWSGALTSY